MKNKPKIGIIGLGFVGGACKDFFSNYNKVYTYDIKVPSNCNNTKELIEKSDIIFICVPTPMKKNGSTDLTTIYNIFSEINNLANLKNKYFCIKSTVPIGTCDDLSKKFNKCNIVFNPEFLTERNALNDFKNQNRIILGGHKKSFKIISDFYDSIFSNIPIVKTDYKTAEYVKYLTNSFLATKVSFANEMESLCFELNIDYSEVVRISTLDPRLGKTHWKVPGIDGKKGYGGSCFPKDIASLIFQFEENNVVAPIINASWERNKNIDRSEQDWKDLKGRAVSED